MKILAIPITKNIIPYDNTARQTCRIIELFVFMGNVYYIYDATGIAGMVYDGRYYYFDKNVLGDVMAIRDHNGNVVATYEYDAWGNIMDQSGSMANVNPFRYRGYYYDVETGFYYLQTRYYDPEIMRFINADNYELVGTLARTPGQLNMYAYCNNNPVMFTDKTGKGVVTSLLIASILIGIGVGASVGGYVAYTNNENILAGTLIGGIVGGVCGAITYFTISGQIPLLVSSVLTGIANGGGTLLNNYINYQNIDMSQALISGLISGIVCLMPIYVPQFARGQLGTVVFTIFETTIADTAVKDFVGILSSSNTYMLTTNIDEDINVTNFYIVRYKEAI